MINMVQVLGGTLLAASIAVAAYYFGSLTRGGAWAAALVGTLTFGVGGWGPALLLLAFFITSSALSRAGGLRKARLRDAFEKGSRRDQHQVLANGSLAAILSLGYGLTGDSLWLLGIAGSLSAAAADTWATELGVLARARPVLITTGKPVDPGTSGGVTAIGILASLAGAGLIGTLTGIVTISLAASGIILVVGVLGSTLDSLMGATVQSVYHCPACMKETERHPVHLCGSETTYLRGWRWLGNDQVNLLANTAGALLAVLAGWTLLIV